MNEREIVSRWIEERGKERDAPALTWCLQRTLYHLLDCFPPEARRDVLWGMVRTVIGPEG